MKNFLLLIFTFLHFCLSAQISNRYASVRISLIGKNMADLVLTGIETEHGEYYPGRSITVVLSTLEIERVQHAGFQTEILIADLQQYYLEHQNDLDQVQLRGGECTGNSPQIPAYITPANYSFGTMGGYLTYDQMMAELDKMRVLYPSLISARKITSDTILTWEGRPIYNVKISDNPDVDEPERQVLYTALHHAREPNSASQLIFYMWYLLENYASRPDIQVIVNNLEMYFVPCINVDGYIFNEMNSPNGGGLWRKNRRDNGDGTFGVDLNRNYGYFWGDFGGSSPNPPSETYRGPEAFSEPESRTMRDFCRAHEFLFVYNYHATGNLLIYPWAYSDSPADSAFIKYGEHFTQENHYHAGTTTETVGYNVNGSSDDWMYSEGGSYSFTPEVGRTGFWPPSAQIDQLNKENLWQNLSMAYSALRYGVAEDLSSTEVFGHQGQIDVAFVRYGLLNEPVTVTLAPFSSNISSNSVGHSFDNAHFEKTNYSFPYQLSAGIQPGDAVVFLLKTDNGLWIKTDTLRKTFGGNLAPTSVTAFQDNIDNFANWDGNWAVTDEAYYSAPSSMTDSPNSNYEENAISACFMQANTTIPANAVGANLRFYAKWAIEAKWDYVQVVGYGQNGFEEALCGRYTKTGVNTQADGPIFDGTQNDWVAECMDISNFIGQTINVVFFLGSDNGTQLDGFYFDDIVIEYFLETSGTNTISLSTFNLKQNEPNPTSGQTSIQWNSTFNVLGEKANLLVFNALGKIVLDKNVNPNAENQVTINTQKLAPGIYSYLLRSEKGQSQTMKMVVVR